jgi:hypothetical protein
LTAGFASAFAAAGAFGASALTAGFASAFTAAGAFGASALTAGFASAFAAAGAFGAFRLRGGLRFGFCGGLFRFCGLGGRRFLFRGGGQLPALVVAVHVLPDLQAGAGFRADADHIDALAGGQLGLDLHAAVVQRLHDPHLRGAVCILPLVQPGAVGAAAHHQVEHFARAVVPHAVNALAHAQESPLLIGFVRIDGQLNGRAVRLAGHALDHLAGRIRNGIKLIRSQNGLCNFLHLGIPPVAPHVL